MLWRNSEECVVSEKSCSKNSVNFQEKHPSKTAFLNKVAGYLTLTGNAHLGNLWNFQNSFHKKHPQMPASELVVTGNVSTKIYFSKNISFDFSHLCFDIKWHMLPGIKCITDVKELNIWIRRIVIF